MRLTKQSTVASVVSFKVLIATLGGYAFISGYVAFVSIVLSKLGMEIGEAVMLSAMTGIIVYLCVIFWIFTTKKIWQTSAIIILMAVVMTIVSLYLTESFQG